MTKISAEVIADSITEQGHRLTTMKVVFPRYILAEFNTHRMFSRNSASSRAIPFEKMVEAVQKDPFIPIAWQKDHKGMQGMEYIDGDGTTRGQSCIDMWLDARDKAVEQAIELHKFGVTKQLCNRLLEPFMWHTVLVSFTEVENFFSLRCPQYEVDGRVYRSKQSVFDYIQDVEHPCWNWTDMEWLPHNKGQAEIHMMALAEAMWDAYNESEPKKLEAEEWHIPFGDQIDWSNAQATCQSPSERMSSKYPVTLAVKIATARCARISYTTVGSENEHSYEQDIALHDRLVASGHWSPFEHCARVMNEQEYEASTHAGWASNPYDTEHGWSGNFRGFLQYRKMFAGENRTL